MTRPSLTAMAAIAALALGVDAAWSAEAQSSDIVKAGVSAAVRGEVSRSNVKQAVARKVGSGQDIFLGDHVTSGNDSGMQILLLDETVFTIGPQADMVIDDFVYDPSTGTGKLAASVTKGAFRFVTGRVAANNPSDMEVNTPAATIGIRGTMVAGRTDGHSALIVLLGPGYDSDSSEHIGRATVSNKYGSVELYGPGYGTFVRGPDQPPDQPFLIGLDELLRLDLAAGVAHAGNQGRGGGTVHGGQASSIAGATASQTSQASATVSAITNTITNNTTIITNTIKPPQCVPHLGSSC